MKQLNRQDVYGVIDTERAHQDRKWGTVEKHPHEVGAWLTIMRNILTQADAAWSQTDGDMRALEEVRKLAATAVACGEQHGLRPRWHGELKERMREAKP